MPAAAATASACVSTSSTEPSVHSAIRACRSPGPARRRRRGRLSSSSATCSGVMPPARRICGGPLQKSTMVLSTPTGHGPPSRTTSRSGSRNPARSSTTWAAVVGLTSPKRFADGAASPVPVSRISSSVIGWAGTRSPTESRPPVTSSGTRSDRGTMIVSGPGHDSSASRRASIGTSTRPAVEIVDVGRGGRSADGLRAGP